MTTKNQPPAPPEDAPSDEEILAAGDEDGRGEETGVPPGGPAGPEMLASNIDAIMQMPAIEERITRIAAQAAAAAVAAALGGDTGPPKMMRAKVHDRFVTEANGSGDVKRHFRCENAIATKILERDMTLFRRYEAGELEVPKGRSSNGFERPMDPWNAAIVPNSFITFIDGHCFTYTDNQTEVILYVKELPPERGGMPGIYEDFGSVADWVCTVCQPQKNFTDQRTWEGHMQAAHGVTPSEVALAAAR